MPLRKIAVTARRSLRSNRLLQIGAVLVFWLIGEGLARVTGWPIPGGIFGMVILLSLLASGAFSQASVRRGANWFVAEMLLFFIPAVLAVLDHHEFLGVVGLKVLAIIVSSTALVMGVTAVVVEFGFRVVCSAKEDSHGVE